MDELLSATNGAALAAYATAATLLHFATAAIAARKMKQGSRIAPGESLADVPVTLIRPVCGLDASEEVTLRSTFGLSHQALDVIFCAASERDKAVPFLRELIAANPHVKARLLIGDERPTANPKLNNILKGWRAARTSWIVMADSNVLMSKTYVAELLSTWESGTGLVCSPPVGAGPDGFWAEVECAFLNTYQARWQLSADWMGFAFAQGKSMLWRRADLEAAGGITALGAEIAEDAAATKIVRNAGLNVRLVDRPFPQLIGHRSLRQMWDRQVRWARLRRATFLPYYVPEALTGSLFPTIAAALAAHAMGQDPLITIALMQGLWLAAEAALNHAAGWHMSWKSPFAWILRDLALPCLWVTGFYGNTFTWRGNEMSVASQPEKAASVR